MPIYSGANEVEDIYVGSTPVEEVYHGTELIWPLPVEVTYHTTDTSAGTGSTVTLTGVAMDLSAGKCGYLALIFRGQAGGSNTIGDITDVSVDGTSINSYLQASTVNTTGTTNNRVRISFYKVPFIASVLDGATHSIAITMAGGSGSPLVITRRVFTWSLEKLRDEDINDSDDDVQTGFTPLAPAPVALKNGAVLVALFGTSSFGTPTYTTTGVTERADTGGAVAGDASNLPAGALAMSFTPSDTLNAGRALAVSLR